MTVEIPPYGCYANATGVQPTRETHFNRQPLVRVTGHITQKEELNCGNIMLPTFTDPGQFDFTDDATRLLDEMGIPELPGIRSGQSAEYLQAVAFSASNASHSIDSAVSEPYAQRGITVNFGFVLPTGEVKTEINVVGIGVTASRSIQYMTMNRFNRNGVVTKDEVASQVASDILLRGMNIRTSYVLPPVTLEQLYVNGQYIDPLKFYGENIFLFVDGHGDNTRVRSLFRGRVPAAFDIQRDIPDMRSDIPTTVYIARARILPLLAQAEAIFNAESNVSGHFFIGCSPYLYGDFSFESYAKAFGDQVARNTGHMLSNYVFHNNLTTHNVSLDGSFVDWDTTSRIKRKPCGLKKKKNSMPPARLLRKMVYTLIRTYEMVNIVSGITIGRDIPFCEHVNRVLTHTDDGHPLRNMTALEIQRLGGNASEWRIRTSNTLFADLSRDVRNFFRQRESGILFQFDPIHGLMQT